MNEGAKITLLDGSSADSSLFSMMPTTMDHWVSESSTPEFSIDFDEPVKILDVVLKPKFVVSNAPSEFMQSREEEEGPAGVFEGREPENFSFKNFDLTEGGRLEPDMMGASFKNIT